MLFLPALVIPVCDVQLVLLGAVCNWVLVGHNAGSCSPPQWMHLFLMLERPGSTIVCTCVVDESFLLLFCGHLYGRWPSCLHLPQNGSMGQSCLGCPGCLHLQQMISGLFAAKLFDCFTPCPFLLLVLVSASEVWMKGNGAG